jgi:hypothetical protein
MRELTELCRVYVYVLHDQFPQEIVSSMYFTREQNDVEQVWKKTESRVAG